MSNKGNIFCCKGATASQMNLLEVYIASLPYNFTFVYSGHLERNFCQTFLTTFTIFKQLPQISILFNIFNLLKVICIRPHFTVRKIVIDVGGSGFLSSFLLLFQNLKHLCIWNKLDVYILLVLNAKWNKLLSTGNDFTAIQKQSAGTVGCILRKTAYFVCVTLASLWVFLQQWLWESGTL